MGSQSRESFLTIKTFGGLSIRLDDGKDKIVLSDLASALLVTLASERRAVPKSRLLEILAPAQPSREAACRLARCIDEISGSLPKYLDVDRQHISLNPLKPLLFDRNEIDFQVSQVQEHLQLDGQLSRSLTFSLERVLTWYAGPFLSGFYLESAPRFNEWVSLERTRLELLAHDGYEILASLFADLGETERSIFFTQQVISLQPRTETAYQRLMQLLINVGRRSEALSVYQTCVEILGSQFGRQPHDKTQALYEAIRDDQPLPNKSSRFYFPPLVSSQSTAPPISLFNSSSTGEAV
ncbi:MAG: bacterial transcriptional activator domain-containing protein [Chloroflexota bacterium]